MGAAKQHRYPIARSRDPRLPGNEKVSLRAREKAIARIDFMSKPHLQFRIIVRAERH